MQHDFRPPIFVRDDDQNELTVNVVVWGTCLGGLSIQFANGNESVLVDAVDWERIKKSVDLELEKAS